MTSSCWAEAAALIDSFPHSFFRSERPLIFFLCLVRPLCRFPPSGPLLFILCVLFLLVSSFRSSPFFSACDLACSFSFDANWDFLFSYEILIFRGSSEFSIPLKIGYCLTSQVAQSGLVICFVSSIHSFYEIERYTQLPWLHKEWSPRKSSCPINANRKATTGTWVKRRTPGKRGKGREAAPKLFVSYSYLIRSWGCRSTG